MDAEFDDVARWTLDAVRQLGADHAIAAACRGSASPAALDWLGATCELSEGTPLLDVGGGMGGPAAYAAQAFGACPAVVEPAPGACRTARELFALPVVQASGERLPTRTASVRAVWCLGVLCTVADKAPVLAELRRVLEPGGALGLLVLVAARPRLVDVPEGNHFPTDPELAGLLDGAGFTVAARAEAADLPDAPAHWQEQMDRVAGLVAAGHAGDERLEEAGRQEATMHRLLTAGDVSARLLHLTAG